MLSRYLWERPEGIEIQDIVLYFVIVCEKDALLDAGSDGDHEDVDGGSPPPMDGGDVVVSGN